MSSQEFAAVMQAMRGTYQLALPNDYVAQAFVTHQIDNNVPLITVALSLQDGDGKMIAREYRHEKVTYAAFTMWCALRLPNA